MYSYKRTVKQFPNLKIRDRVLFFIKCICWVGTQLSRETVVILVHTNNIYFHLKKSERKHRISIIECPAHEVL